MPKKHSNNGSPAPAAPVKFWHIAVNIQADLIVVADTAEAAAALAEATMDVSVGGPPGGDVFICDAVFETPKPAADSLDALDGPTLFPQ
jgi:hypothetical protein